MADTGALTLGRIGRQAGDAPEVPSLLGPGIDGSKMRSGSRGRETRKEPVGKVRLR